MRISFENGGYIEFQKSNKPYHVFVAIAAKSNDNPLKLLINSAEIQLKELLECVKSVSGPVLLENLGSSLENQEKES